MKISKQTYIKPHLKIISPMIIQIIIIIFLQSWSLQDRLRAGGDTGGRLCRLCPSSFVNGHRGDLELHWLGGHLRAICPPPK